MSAPKEDASLGPSGWPYVTGHGGQPRFTLGGVDLWSLLEAATEIGTVRIGDGDYTLIAYETTIDGRAIRFAFGEVTNLHWMLASNDAEVALKDNG